MNSWQELDNLREVIDCKLEGTFTKKNYCRKLSDLIEKNRQLNARCKPLIEKYSNSSYVFMQNIFSARMIRRTSKGSSASTRTCSFRTKRS